MFTFRLRLFHFFHVALTRTSLGTPALKDPFPSFSSLFPLWLPQPLGVRTVSFLTVYRRLKLCETSLVFWVFLWRSFLWRSRGQCLNSPLDKCHWNQNWWPPTSSRFRFTLHAQAIDVSVTLDSRYLFTCPDITCITLDDSSQAALNSSSSKPSDLSPLQSIWVYPKPLS